MVATPDRKAWCRVEVDEARALRADFFDNWAGYYGFRQKYSKYLAVYNRQFIKYGSLIETQE